MATLRIVFAGCLTGIAALAASPAAVTFNKDVLPILEKNCQGCHRPGEVAPFPLLSGSVIRCRPIGLLGMTDESGEDSKILAVPIDKTSILYKDIKAPEDFPQSFLLSISHFFQHYKDLEPGKWVKVNGWGDVEEAKAEILSCIERYKDSV